jgi:hypothetical protein
MMTNVSFYHFWSCNYGFVFGLDFLKILKEVGKWIKYKGKQFLPKTDFPFTSYDKKLVFLQRMSNFFLDGHTGKTFLFQSVWSTLAKLFARFSSSLGQDLTVKNTIFIFIFFLFGLLQLEMVDLRYFLRKMPLSCRDWAMNLCGFYFYFLIFFIHID